jgi:hypothetical protein
MVVVGTSILVVNVANWYHSWWRDTRSKEKSSNKESNGNNHYPIGKHVEKVTRALQGGFYP